MTVNSDTASRQSENTDLTSLTFCALASQSLAPTGQPANDTRSDVVGILLLNRADAANAMNAELMESITKRLSEVAGNKNCRVLIVSGRGKHFSAGADLNWMKASAKLSHAENITDANKLTKMFEALSALTIPTVAVVKGAAYGGAVGLAACCDVTIALDTARFCLSEAKLGIAPSVIMPYLMRKMLPGQLRRLALSAQVFSGNEALANGLVEVSCTEAEVDQKIRQEVNALLACGPNAQAGIKALIPDVLSHLGKQGPYTAELIAKLRTSPEGQAGLGAFFSKLSPPWTTSLPDTWSFNALCS